MDLLGNRKLLYNSPFPVTRYLSERLTSYSSCRGVSVFSAHNSICRTTFSEHFPEIAHQRFRFLVRSEMPTTLMFRLEDNITNRPRPPKKLGTNQLK